MTITPTNKSTADYSVNTPHAVEDPDRELKNLLIQQMSMIKSLTSDLAEMKKQNKERDQAIEDLSEILKKVSEPKEATNKEKIMDAARTISTIGGAALIVLSMGSVVVAGATALMIAPTVTQSISNIAEYTQKLSLSQPCHMSPVVHRVNTCNSIVEGATTAQKMAIFQEAFKQPETREEMIKQFTETVSRLTA